MTVVAVTAQLAEGVSLETASAEANGLGLQLRGIEALPGESPRFEIVRELDQTTARVAPALRLLVVAVAIVLLIVCINVANLLLVRGTHRRQEIAVRKALGASRARIALLVLSESLVLAVVGGLLGTALAYGGVRALKAAASSDLPDRFARALGPTILPRLEEISIDPAVLLFLLGVSLATGLLFGLLPALRLSRFGERNVAAGRALSAARDTRIGRALATAQLGLAVALLISAGLLLHSFLKLAAVDAGFDARGVLSFDLVIPSYYTPEQKLATAENLVTRLRASPRVASVGYTDTPPLERTVQLASAFIPEGMTEAEMREEASGLPMQEQTQSRTVSSGYLRALGARLVSGRWFDEGPAGAAGLTALVSKPYVERYFPEANPVGATLRASRGVLTIVGVVDDIHLRGLDSEPERIVFLEPRQQLAWRRAAQTRPSPEADRMFLTMFGGSVAFAVRSADDPLAVAPDLRAIVRQIDPALAVDNVMSLEQVLSGTTTRPRFYATLLGAFGAIAAVIAVIGIYGVLAYVVGQRTNEIGIRMALGARQSAVLMSVMRGGAVMVGVGIAAGLAGAVAVTRYLEGMLFGLSTLDATTYAEVALAFAAVSLAACYVPARHATRIDPLAAVRHE